MGTFDDGVARRVDDLAQRVLELERFRFVAESALRRLGATSEPPRERIAPPTQPVVVPATASEPESTPVLEIAAPLPNAAPSLAPPTRIEPAPRTAGPRVDAARRVVGLKKSKPMDAFSIERLIGGRWLAACGALIVVIGVALFLKFAYDQGWLGGLSPAARCGIAGAFGLALLGAGEVIRRRVNALASVGLFAAGIGTCYATSFAAHSMYALLDPALTMSMLIACVGLGIVIGAATNLAAVAVFSLLGGYLAPILLWRNEATPWFMPAYLLALLAVSLVLSGWKSLRFAWFSVLRTIAWWGTLLFGVIWTMSTGAEHPALALPFFALVWGSTHFERFLSARRQDAVKPGSSESVTFGDARLLAGSLSTTAWCALLAIIVLDEAEAPMWWATSSLAVVTFSLAVVFIGRARAVLDVPRTPVARLSAGMAIQTGALVIASIALAFSGWVQIAAGLALAVASVAVGRWMKSLALDLYGMAVLIFACVSLAGAMTWNRELVDTIHTRWVTLRGDDWSWRIALTAGAWLACALLMLIRNSSRVPVHAITSAAAGVFGLGLVFAHERADTASMAVYWGVLAGALMVASPLVPRLRLVWMGRAMLAAAVGAAFRCVVENSADHEPLLQTGLEWTRWTIPFLVASGGACVSAWRAPRGTTQRSSVVAVVSALSAVGLLVFPFAHEESSALALSVYWGAIGIAAAMTPKAWHDLALRPAALVALALATGAAILAFPFGDWNIDSSALGLHPGLLLALGLAAAWQLGARRIAGVLRDSDWRRAALRGGWIVAGALVFAASSLEAARAAAVLTQDSAVQRAAVSIYWGLFSIGLLLIGYVWRSASTRYVGLGLINIAAAKVVFVDLVGVPPGWRIASFIGLGLLMIGTAAAYSRLAGRAPRVSAEAGSPASS